MDLSPYVKDRSPAVTAARVGLLRQLDLLFLLLRELPGDARRAPEMQQALARAGVTCLSARRTVLGDAGAPSPRPDLGGSPAGSPAALAVILPLLGCVEGLAAAAHDARQPGRLPAPTAEQEERTSSATVASSSTTQQAVRFALKVTLAAMTAYIVYTSLAWQGIHTAMLTCYFVAQDSVEATIHKLTLRIVGACIGGALGIGAIVFVLPQLETVGGLAVLVAAVTLFAAWIATGSPAISYAGLQIAFAFYLTVLQGFSRTARMVVGRDRVIGILLGNLLMAVVFTHLWPVGLGASVRQALSRAAEALAAMMRSGSARPGGRELLDAETAVHAGLQKAIQATRLRHAEAGDLDGSWLVPALERLYVPLHAIASQPLDPQVLPPAVHTALFAMGEGAARWLSELARAIARSGPIPVFQPAVSAAELEQLLGGEPAAEGTMATVLLRLAWYRLLEQQIQRFPAHPPRPSGKAT